MTYRAMTQKSDLPECMYLPRFLNEIPCSSSSKLLYCILLDAALTKGRRDERGQLYVCFSISELNNCLLRGESTTKRLLHELEDFGLLKRQRKHIGKPSWLYIYLPEEETPKSAFSELRSERSAASAFA